MSISCTICGMWYATPDRDTIDICPDCFLTNFSGAMPALDPCGPAARAALEAYVTAPVTPRQGQALRRLHERWAHQAQGEAPAPTLQKPMPS